MNAVLPEGLTEATLIGKGGFSNVYRAHQTRFDRWVAVKVLDAANLDAAAARRFERECAAMGRLSTHPNVITVYESGFTASGHPFLVLELCRGSLADHVRASGVMSPEAVASVARKMASALQAAHAIGMVHRDVKPGNILLTEYGEPVLADFGLSLRPNVDATRFTEAYTPSHAAPETVEQGAATPASDTYALSSTLYSLLTGTPPFPIREGESLYQHSLRVLRDAPEELVLPGYDELQRIIMRGLVKEPSRRAVLTDFLAVGTLQDRTMIRPPAPPAPEVEVALPPPAAEMTQSSVPDVAVEPSPGLWKPQAQEGDPAAPVTAPAAKGKRRLLAGAAAAVTVALLVTGGILLASSPGCATVLARATAEEGEDCASEDVGGSVVDETVSQDSSSAPSPVNLATTMLTDEELAGAVGYRPVTVTQRLTAPYELQGSVSPVSCVAAEQPLRSEEEGADSSNFVYRAWAVQDEATLELEIVVYGNDEEAADRVAAVREADDRCARYQLNGSTGAKTYTRSTHPISPALGLVDGAWRRTIDGDATYEWLLSAGRVVGRVTIDPDTVLSQEEMVAIVSAVEVRVAGS